MDGGVWYGMTEMQSEIEGLCGRDEEFEVFRQKQVTLLDLGLKTLMSSWDE